MSEESIVGVPQQDAVAAEKPSPVRQKPKGLGRGY